MLKPLCLPRTPALMLLGAALALSGCGRDQALPLGVTLTDDAGVLDGDLADVPLSDATVTDTGALDAGVPDFGLPDADVPDFGLPDAFVPDTGLPDTGAPDAFVPDTGTPDTGTPDTGVTDAGTPDAFVPDTGTPDTGTPDAFVPDTGTPDTGTPDTGVTDASVPDSGVPCPLGCGFLDDACNVGVCAPDGMTCVRQPRRNGTACDDGDACTTGDVCQVGVCQAGAPVDCSAFDDACNVGVCAPSTGQCGALPVPDGAPCDDNVSCTTSSCVGGACLGVPEPPPAGDTCADPVLMNVLPGAQSQTGNNECASDANPAVCGAAGGADLVYEASFAETRRIRLETVTPAGGAGYDTVIVANEGVCGPSPLPVAPLCDDDGGQGAFSRLDDVFSPGTWFFTVDADGAAEVGDYELMVEVDPHDTCADPSVITVPPMGQVDTYFGNTSGNANDYEASCAGRARSADQVWRFDVSAQVTLRFETVQPANGRYDTALHVRESLCADAAAEIACDDDAGLGTFSRIERTFDPGTYFLIVDGFSTSSEGEYQLEVSQPGPVNSMFFPATGDARQPLSGGFSAAGEFVEGIRTLPISAADRMDVDLEVTNALTCDAAFFLVRLNNSRVGTLTVRPGDTRVTQSFTFPSVAGPGGRFNIRYELQRTISAGCGEVLLPDDVSMVGLAN